jgi:phage host-nuclease inhibitor protein Gam
MAKKKKATIHTVIATEAGLEAAINSYVDTSLKLLKRKAKQEKEIAALKVSHDQENKADEDEVLSLEAGIQLYCTTHRTVLFPDEEKKKSREYGNATIGFRLNPHAVSKLISKDTWERIAERLDSLPWGEAFVKTTLAVDKDAILKCRAELPEKQLAEAGIEITQGETFFLEPKSELLEAARNPVESEVAA